MHQIKTGKKISDLICLLSLILGHGVVSLMTLHINTVLIVGAIFRYRDAQTLLFLSQFKQFPPDRQ